MVGGTVRQSRARSIAGRCGGVKSAIDGQNRRLYNGFISTIGATQAELLHQLAGTNDKMV
jgi:hypothetical protein